MTDLQTQIVDVGRQRIRVAVRPGDRANTPLLMANGAGAGLEALQPFVDALDDSIEVIRFDAPGVSGSAMPTLPYRFPSLVRALGSVLDQLGYERVDMLGLSWGSALTQQFAKQNPDRLRRMVLVSSSPGTLMVPPARASLLWTMATLRRFNDRRYAARVVSAAYGGSSRGNPEPALKILHGGGATFGGWKGYYYQLAASAGWTSEPWLGSLKQPTLILAGNDDPIIPLVNA
jgi:poly(3-hydroxyalkanoate) depolymerase